MPATAAHYKRAQREREDAADPVAARAKRAAVMRAYRARKKAEAAAALLARVDDDTTTARREELAPEIQEPPPEVLEPTPPDTPPPGLTRTPPPDSPPPAAPSRARNPSPDVETKRSRSPRTPYNTRQKGGGRWMMPQNPAQPSRRLRARMNKAGSAAASEARTAVLADARARWVPPPPPQSVADGAAWPQLSAEKGPARRPKFPAGRQRP